MQLELARARCASQFEESYIQTTTQHSASRHCELMRGSVAPLCCRICSGRFAWSVLGKPHTHTPRRTPLATYVCYYSWRITLPVVAVLQNLLSLPFVHRESQVLRLAVVLVSLAQILSRRDCLLVSFSRGTRWNVHVRDAFERTDVSLSPSPSSPQITTHMMS